MFAKCRENYLINTNFLSRKKLILLGKINTVLRGKNYRKIASIWQIIPIRKPE